MPPRQNPLQIPGDYYSVDEESSFRKELETAMLDISGRIDSVEDGKSTVNYLSSISFSMFLVPVGQVEIG